VNKIGERIQNILSTWKCHSPIGNRGFAENSGINL